MCIRVDATAGVMVLALMFFMEGNYSAQVTHFSHISVLRCCDSSCIVMS